MTKKKNEKGKKRIRETEECMKKREERMKMNVYAESRGRVRDGEEIEKMNVVITDISVYKDGLNSKIRDKIERNIRK